MPRLPGRPLATRLDPAATGTSSALSSDAIFGIAGAGSVVFFVCLALVLGRIARVQARRRNGVAVCPASGASFAVGVDDGADAEVKNPPPYYTSPGPKRLRKKSFVTERCVDFDGVLGAGEGGGVGGGRNGRGNGSVDILERERELEIGTGSREGRISIPPVLPPVVLSRPGSFTLGPLTRRDSEDAVAAAAVGSARSSADVKRKQKQKQKSARRRSSQDVVHARRSMTTTTWIDEDALHGPPMASSRRKSSGGRGGRGAKARGEGEGKMKRRSGGGGGGGGFLGGLGRSLSRKLSWRAEVTEIIRSPTLPYTDSGNARAGSSAQYVPDWCRADAQVRLAGALGRDADLNAGSDRAAITMPMTISTVQSQVVSVSTPRKVCVQEPGVTGPGRGSHCGFIVGVPSDSVHNPKYRSSNNSNKNNSNNGNGNNSNHNNNSNNDDNNANANGMDYMTEALEAAQRLAGGARVPISVPVPQSQQQQQQSTSTPSPHRRPRSAKSATDADLAGILRSTAERLQDGGRSVRRQTIAPVPQSQSQANGSFLSAAHAKGYYQDGASAESSPAKSQKSAPAVMSCAELEGSTPRSHQSQGGTSSFSFAMIAAAAASPASSSSPATQGGPALGHRRQASHMSFASMISEPDSLVPGGACSKRASEIPTALSSPSRREGEAGAGSLRGCHDGPCSPASCESSALSTLYSEDEPPLPHMQIQAPPQSPPISELRLDATPTTADRKHAATSSCNDDDVFGSGNGNGSGGRGSRFAFENGESPRPWRGRRRAMTTMAQANLAAPDGYVSSQQQQQQYFPTIASDEHERSLQPLSVRTSLQFMIHAYDARDKDAESDPFLPRAPVSTPEEIVPQPLQPHSLPPTERSVEGGKSNHVHDHSAGAINRGELPVVSITRTVAAEQPAPSPARPSSTATIIPPPQRLRPIISSPTLGGGSEGTETSPVMSETGLSSVYDSYADTEDVIRGSATSLVTVPTVTGLPIKHNSVAVRQDAPSGRESRVGFRASSGSEKYYVQATTEVEIRADGVDSAAATGPRSPRTILRMPQAKRGSRDSQDSDRSRYSQDDVLPPLLLTPTKQNKLNVTANANAGGCLGVAGAVAELRRMNSQVSNTSGYSSASASGADGGSGAKAAPSPTLPALRGGGFSPGRNKGGGRNYLAMGGSPTGSPKSARNKSAESSPVRGGGGMDRKEVQRRSFGGVPAARARRGTVTLGGSVDDGRAVAASTGLQEQVRGSRDGGVAGARVSGVLREGGGGNVGAGSSISTSMGSKQKQQQHQQQQQQQPPKPPRHAVMTRASQLVREEKQLLSRASVESLGLYDEQGFLKSSPLKADSSSPLSKPS